MHKTRSTLALQMKQNRALDLASHSLATQQWLNLVSHLRLTLGQVSLTVWVQRLYKHVREVSFIFFILAPCVDLIFVTEIDQSSITCGTRPPSLLHSGRGRD